MSGQKTACACSGRAGKTRGFTLIEILVATLILAILAVAAYGGLNSLIKEREITHTHNEHFRTLQLAMATIGRDLSQAAARPVRLSSGTFAPAMMGGANNIPVLAFTRNGRPNPLQEPRSDLERIAYLLDGTTLKREVFPVLDRSATLAPAARTLLAGVSSITLAFMDESRQSHAHWPPLNAEPGAYVRREPIAVQITLDTKRWGKIRRLIPVTP
ncbi:MAG: type II secretion system minor pseudopilin GspJ [Gammaproteobacteria bacterium]